jgi:peptidoglycan lytic transglycosylase
VALRLLQSNSVAVNLFLPFRNLFAESWLASASLRALAILTICSAIMLTGCGEVWSPDFGPFLSYRMSASRPARWRRTPRTVEPVEPLTDERIVKASWYGGNFSGHRTASGERFNPNSMTAASKTLPIGSIVHVTNPENGRSVNVRINDRGPYVRGRSLDLSRGAAHRIGLRGVAHVKVTPVPTFSETATASMFE